jgi:pectate lyase
MLTPSVLDRCRFGLFHVINNDYINWQMYAIGGSASPTILSHGNRFLADKDKEVFISLRSNSFISFFLQSYCDL